MKTKVLFIIFIFLHFGLNSQSVNLESDCPQPLNGIIITLGDSITDSETVRHSEILISLWDKYNFVDEEGYSIVIENPKSEEQGYLISDINTLKNIKNTYKEVTTVYNTPCESQNTSSVILIKNKQLVESATINWDCSILETECGPINFNSLLFSEGNDKIFIEIENKVYQTENELNLSIKTATSNDKVLLLSNEKEFMGKVEFVLEDGVEELNQLYKDDFYMDIVKERIKNQKAKRKSKIELNEEGKILEQLIRRKYKQIDFELERWKIDQGNPQDYIVVINYLNEGESLEFDNILRNWDTSKHELTLLKLKK